MKNLVNRMWIFGGVFASVMLTGCSSTPAVPIFVECAALKNGNTLAVLTNVEQNDVQIKDATVEVGGFPVAWNEGMSSYYFYGTASIDAGDDVTLDVIVGSSHLNTSVVMPGTPVVSAPTTAGSPYNTDVPIIVQWGAISPTPDQMELLVDGAATRTGLAWSFVGAGNLTQASIPANTLSYNMMNVSVGVISDNSMPYLSDGMETGSSYLVGNIAYSELITTSPQS